MLIRIIVISLIITLLAYLLRRLLTRTPHTTQSPSSDSHTPQKIIICDYCGVHFPEQEAFTHQHKHFCCVEHLKKGTDAV